MGKPRKRSRILVLQRHLNAENAESAEINSSFALLKTSLSTLRGEIRTALNGLGACPKRKRQTSNTNVHYAAPPQLVIAVCRLLFSS